jgi:2-succinyl-5-enolpyruvyl-6-hydroxy-3-cyclohexene-1-carboxylate synthase
MPDGRAHEGFGKARWRLQGPWWEVLPGWPAPHPQVVAPRQAWLRRWQDAQARLEGQEKATNLVGAHPEASWLKAVLDVTPIEATVLVGNSLPIRHLESFGLGWGHRGLVLGIRGAAGIDGVTAQAIGAAWATGTPTLLLTGDVSFLHDLNALLAGGALAQAGGSLLVVVVNNDGGGHLPPPAGGAKRTRRGF